MKRLRTAAAVLVISCAFRLLIGCGGGDGGAPVGNFGSVEGWAFVQGGAVILRNAAGAPAGSTILANAPVTITGRSGGVSTDSAGHFLLANTPIGQRTMQIAPPTGSAAAPLDVPVTVIKSATIQTGQFAISRQNAIDAAKAALPGTASGYRLLAPQQPLPTGVVLTPALGNDDGAPDPALDYTVASPRWLVYADGFPYERFQHPVSYILVDAATGAVTKRDATSWPRLNDVSNYADDDKNEVAQDLVQKGRSRAFSTFDLSRVREAARKTRDHVPGATDPKTVALYIDGNSRSDMMTDFENVQAKLFGAGGLNGPVSAHTWFPPESGVVDAQSQVRQLFNAACAEAREQDTLLIYITSHGSKSGAIYLQQGPESDESTTKDAYFWPFLLMDTTQCKACHVIIIMDTCYSGQAMVDLDVKTPPRPGQKRTIIASSTSGETSGGITKVGHIISGRTQGGVFTNAFLDALSAYSTAHGGAAQSNLQEIFNDAVQRMNSTTQHPQTVFRWDGKSCGAPAALIQVTPTNVTATHTVGETQCPQSLGNLTIKNVSGLSLNYSLSSSSSYFNLSGSGGTLSAGLSKSYGLSFNCGKVPPLTASVQVTATAGELNQTVTVPVQLNKGP